MWNSEREFGIMFCIKFTTAIKSTWSWQRELHARACACVCVYTCAWITPSHVQDKCTRAARSLCAHKVFGAPSKPTPTLYRCIIKTDQFDTQARVWTIERNASNPSRGAHQASHAHQFFINPPGHKSTWHTWHTRSRPKKNQRRREQFSTPPSLCTHQLDFRVGKYE